MTRDEAIALLRAHEVELREAGVSSLSIFGSVARDETTDVSDVDIVVRFRRDMPAEGFAHFGRLDDLTRRLAAVFDRNVDVIAEPVRKPQLRREIEREAVRAF